MASDRATLIFDGECGLCQDAVRLVQRWDRDHALEYVPFQDADRVARFGIDLPSLAAAMHLVLPGGGVVAGADALPEILARLPRRAWLAATFRLPGVLPVARRLYAFIAARRRCAVLPPAR